MVHDSLNSPSSGSTISGESAPISAPPFSEHGNGFQQQESSSVLARKALLAHKKAQLMDRLISFNYRNH